MKLLPPLTSVRQPICDRFSLHTRSPPPKHFFSFRVTTPGDLKPKSLFEKSLDLPKRLFETVRILYNKAYNLKKKNLTPQAPTPPNCCWSASLSSSCTRIDPLRRLLAQWLATFRPVTFADDKTILNSRPLLRISSIRKGPTVVKQYHRVGLEKI